MLHLSNGKNNLVFFLTLTIHLLINCEVSVEAKNPKKAFNKNVSRSSTLLELVHKELR